MQVDYRFEDAIRKQKDQERKTKMKPPIFPAKQIVKIIVEETKSKFQTYKLSTFDDEMVEMKRNHIENIEQMETYEEIDNWLQLFRRMSLDEWVPTL